MLDSRAALRQYAEMIFVLTNFFTDPEFPYECRVFMDFNIMSIQKFKTLEEARAGFGPDDEILELLR